ncbi:MAG TPA: hypothetical protein PK413_08320, partial [Thermoanaerobaculia bacterium]|nr:hypothetical protein [Thermoanaerobaculia bacterium]
RSQARFGSAGDTPAPREKTARIAALTFAGRRAISRAKFLEPLAQAGCEEHAGAIRTSSPATPGQGRGKAGRPAICEEKRRIFQLRLRVSREELARIRHFAQLSEACLSDYARHRLLKLPAPARPMPLANVLLCRELARIGNNLNQAVALVHRNRLSAELAPTLAELLERIRAIEETLLAPDSRRGER